MFEKNKKYKCMFLLKIILTMIFSICTVYFIDLGSVSLNITTKVANESDGTRYLIEWFFVVYGGIVGTAVIYYNVFDAIFNLSTLIVRKFKNGRNELEM